MKKKKNQGWFAKSRPKQLVQFTNVKSKITGYKDILPFPQDKIDRIILICDIFIDIYNFVEQSRAKMKSLTDWQDLIYTAEGGTQGDSAPVAPTFQTFVLPTGAFVGIFKEFQELVADIKAADNYTRGIGEDLMIVETEGEERDEAELAPDLKLKTSAASYVVKVSGSMQGFKALKVEYRRKGSEIPQTFFLTELPGEITIIASQAGEPESGHVRAVFFEKNQNISEWSPDYSLTVG